MDKKKIIIISQTIFPAQYPRAHRATELAKEFARQGHHVILYGVLGDYDYSEFEKENNLKVKNIGKMRFARINSEGSSKITFFDKVFKKLLFRLIGFPDIELMFRMPKIIKKEENVDLLITIAMPHPLHWGSAMMRSLNPEEFPKKWIADCGDPYMGNKFWKKKPFFYFKYLEKWFCEKADYITVPVTDAIDAYYPEFHHKIRVIPQGFKFDDVKVTNLKTNNIVPTFAYAGTFYKGFRDPSAFLSFLSTINLPFKFIIFTLNITLIEPYLEKLEGKIEVNPYLPRNELLKELDKMDFLINFENGTKVQSPSKLIDYAIVDKPVLSIEPNSLDKNIFFEFLSGDYHRKLQIPDKEKYRIENVTASFLALFNE